MMFAFASSLLLFSCGTSGSSTRDSTPDSLSPILEVASPASDPSSSLPVPVSVPAPNVVIDFNADIHRINTVYNSSENNILLLVLMGIWLKLQFQTLHITLSVLGPVEVY
ncbi:MAG: hypothetical protein LBL16_04390 [Endomicrobium sp.]|jgi:hypothetical protein|nr:hypothetical protein [Endomicrobium sp.]